eukprot:4437686-Pyramimonas_sp.AAC.1
MSKFSAQKVGALARALSGEARRRGSARLRAGSDPDSIQEPLPRQLKPASAPPKCRSSTARAARPRP